MQAVLNYSVDLRIQMYTKPVPLSVCYTTVYRGIKLKFHGTDTDTDTDTDFLADFRAQKSSWVLTNLYHSRQLTHLFHRRTSRQW